MNIKMIDEPIGLMEPMMPGEQVSALEDLILELGQKSSGLAQRLDPAVQQSIGNLVRSMNCYYSNLIEDHKTHPRDIDKALANNFSTVPEQRNLQLEAVAHIEVQRLIDAGLDPKDDPTSRTYLRWLHYEFCSRLPEDLLCVEDPDTRETYRVIPGEWRTNNVVVGRHTPPQFSNIESFMVRFEEAYSSQILSRSRRMVAAAAAHHRLLWIHPFLDGNGRVTRLMSYALLLRLQVGNPLWSVARGLARNVERYKGLLMQADLPRRNDLDGRGTLSQEALLDFCRFFLEISIDQVNVMTAFLEPGELVRRMMLYCQDEIAAGRLPKRSFEVLREALLAGDLERGRAPEITGYQERSARDVIAALLEKGLLVSDSPKGLLRLGFPLDVVERWFPGLYPVG